jgi:hypothetical protein
MPQFDHKNFPCGDFTDGRVFEGRRGQWERCQFRDRRWKRFRGVTIKKFHQGIGCGNVLSRWFAELPVSKVAIYAMWVGILYKWEVFTRERGAATEFLYYVRKTPKF